MSIENFLYLAKEGREDEIFYYFDTLISKKDFKNEIKEEKNILYWACHNDLNKLVIKLIENGINRIYYAYGKLYEDAYTTLIHTCMNDKMDLIFDIIKLDDLCEPGYICKKGTALFIAIEKGLDNVAIKLIQKFGNYCNPGYVNSFNKTALMLSCENGMENIALELVKKCNKNCRLNQKNLDGQNALGIAISKELKNISIELINHYSDKRIIKNIDKNGYSILMLACYNGLEDIALLLIDKYGKTCKPEHIGNDGNTALILACENGLKKVAIKLIDTFDNRCKPEVFNNKGLTAMIISSYNNFKEIIDELNKFKGLSNPTIYHICNMMQSKDSNKQELTKVALNIINSETDCDSGYIDKKGNTALIIACKNGWKDIANALIIKYGKICKPNKINILGEGAFILAVQKGFKDIILNLTEFIDSNQVGNVKNDMTPLMLACKNGWSDIVIELYPI